MEFINSETFKNLKTAFLRESAAYLEYNFYSVQAKNDGYEDISKILKTTAENERAHAEIWFKLYHTVSDTQENLKNSAELEHFEWSKLYSEFKATAQKEGYPDVAKLFDGVLKIEQSHENTFSKLYKSVKSEKVFKGKPDSVWICLNCGHVHYGKTPPKTCPVCSHPQSYFALKNN